MYQNNQRSILTVGHVDNIPTMQFFAGISRNTQSKSYAIIDGVCPEISNRRIVGYSLTCRIMYIAHYTPLTFGPEKPSYPGSPLNPGRPSFPGLP